MSKELSSALIGIAIVVIIIVPFVIIALNKKMKMKKRTDAFLTKALKHNLNISEFELMDNFSIGLDKESLKLFYIKGNEINPEEFVIDLTHVNKCFSSDSSRSVNTSNKSISVIDRLELVLKYKESTKADTIIEFFNTEHFPHINNELQLLEKWVKLINQLLKIK